jgi:DNA polymerase (family 10)
MSHIKNTKVSDFLYEIADLLELKDVQFKPRAYRRAAQNIENLSKDIEEYYNNNKLDEIAGVGKSIAEKVEEIIETGELQYLKDLRKEFPEHIQDLMEIQGIGPKTITKLNEELNISSIDELEKAAREEKIRKIKGFGPKTEENILHNIEMYRKFQGRFLLGYILPIAQEIEEKLKDLKETKRVDLAGSIRRRKETIGDVDILIASSNPEKIMDFFTKMPEVKRVLSKGETKSTIIISDNLQVDLRVIDESNYGSALQYFTGSKEHNIEVRKLAIDKGYKLSEYGLMDKDKNTLVAAKEEGDIYEAIELKYMEPELRENRGEIEASQKGQLPELVELKDINGDLHMHTKWSEGSHTIEEMANASIDLNYEYIAICDHAKTLQIAQGLKDDEIEEQIDEIHKIDDKIDKITILSGIEANIDSDGKIDVKNEVLKDLDFVIASIHSGFKQSEEKMNGRIINAMHNDYVNVIGHPTGRMLNKREPYEVNLTKVFNEAAELGVFMEINSFPERLDLSDINARKAKEQNVMICINTDSHHKNHLRYMKLGVFTARRGWLEKKNIVNCLSLKELKKIL